ncbi:hypothetical protein AQI88_39350 [Streptomyces cellostaticus]|uniref:Calcium-binding protein n=1 Tax=Streptomyces cellostaticus TaxID=67285 RepID=A0A101NB82_9ACTN|nr:hypothetical protein [Streptomyces cellostaticus]KUM89877.1 hypothetical protein AQI88_39350 [Streptomyces cellostaticus]GHI06866.1 hypothetical protein Scel_51870 [Streptomyces cellostaticus]
MRIRATVAAVSGALALSAFAVPAAHAAPTTLDVTFSNMKVNSGKAITIGATSTVKVQATYTLTHPTTVSVADVDSGPLIYRGTDPKAADSEVISDAPGACTTVSSTTLNCSATITIPANELYNSDAGTWKTGGVAVDNKTGAQKWQGDLGTIPVRRAAKLTADATPEPVRKGATLTVTGKLTRANWEAGTYAGFGGQSVKLQYRKAGTTTYTTVKTITSSSTGALKTTVTASADGYYRYSFAGTSTTSAVSATGDYVDVQ